MFNETPEGQTFSDPKEDLKARLLEEFREKWDIIPPNKDGASAFLSSAIDQAWEEVRRDCIVKIENLIKNNKHFIPTIEQTTAEEIIELLREE